jgi:protein gp37
MARPTIAEILHYYPEFTGVHEACLALPDMDDEDFATLLESIRSNGLARDLLADHTGLLVDGRHRLLACYMTGQEIRIERLRDGADVWEWVAIHNLAHRHLTHSQKTAFGVTMNLAKERAAAKERMLAGKKINPPVTLPEGQKGDSRDKAAASVGVSGRSIDKGAKVREHRPDLFEQMKQGTMDLEPAYREARKAEQQKKTQAVELPLAPAPEKAKVPVVTADGRVSLIDAPKTVRFNSTNDAIDWADWSWNPVTGCEHGCDFCYAREIAHAEKMRPYYPFAFEPAFHAYRLEAPKNTPRPDAEDPRKGRVFVCSMADLFGRWVPQEWIDKVFAACLGSPEWEYLFLTKYPARYAKLPRLIKAWYGASVIQQSDVSRVEKTMAGFKVSSDSIKWVSLEPMQEPIHFHDLSWCDLMVIGAQTATTQPDLGYVAEFAPEFDWVYDVVSQCRAAGVPYYLKANLGLERPGMNLPKQTPRVKKT